jgi:salicylate hydroxylase
VKIAIAGAGIAGLASALALAKKNPKFSIDVFERQQTPATLGAGIQLGPNAFAALYDIDCDLAEYLKNQSVIPNRLVMRDLHSGKILSTLELGESLRTAFGQPYGVMHRATLQNALIERCENQSNLQLHFGQDFIRAGTPDLTVIANGLWSSESRAISNDGEPKLSSIAYRGVVPMHDVNGALSPLDNEVQLWVGPQAHVVVYPMKHPVDGSYVLNVAAFISGQRMKAMDTSLPQKDRTSWATTITSSQLINTLPRLNSTLDGVLRRIQEASVWRVFAGARLKTWHQGSAVLVGDAAHAMLPHLAQGAAFALEDAAALAKYVDGRGAEAIPLALMKFQAERIARCHRAQAAALRYQRIYHATGIVRFARDCVLAMPSLAPEFGGLSWIYAFPKS